MCGQNKHCEDFGPWKLIINNLWFQNFYQTIDRETKQQIIQLKLNIKSNQPKYKYNFTPILVITIITSNIFCLIILGCIFFC